jgi:hypothetical protein
LFRTKIELNNIELNEDKLTILVVGTSSMSSKGPLTYFTFELDLLFKVKLASEDPPDEFEIAL